MLHMVTGGHLRDYSRDRYGERHIPAEQNLKGALLPKIVAAGMTGAITQMFACPMDVVKGKFARLLHTFKPRKVVSQASMSTLRAPR